MMFTKKQILVIGDIMLDTYFYGEVNRISPEAPVPVFRKINEYSVLGGAANVAANLSAVQQEVSVMSIIGDDEAGKKLKKIFDEHRINSDFVSVVENRPTTEKIRFLAKSNNQQILRLDIEEIFPFEHYYDMLNAFEHNISSFDLILISDYAKGFLSTTFTQSIITAANNNNIPILADVKGDNAEKYRYATLLKPNLKELSSLTGLRTDTEEQIVNASKVLKEKCYCKYVLTTLGSKGMILIGDGDPYFIKSAGKEVFDVTGAGDTAIAYLAACIASGFSIRESVNIANIAAGIQVSKVGTSSVYLDEVKRKIYNEKNIKL